MKRAVIREGWRSGAGSLIYPMIACSCSQEVWARLVVSAAATVIISPAAPFYLLSYCGNGSTDCMALAMGRFRSCCIRRYVGNTAKSWEVGISSGNQALTRCAFLGTNQPAC